MAHAAHCRRRTPTLFPGWHVKSISHADASLYICRPLFLIRFIVDWEFQETWTRSDELLGANEIRCFSFWILQLLNNCLRTTTFQAFSLCLLRCIPLGLCSRIAVGIDTLWTLLISATECSYIYYKCAYAPTNTITAWQHILKSDSVCSFVTFVFTDWICLTCIISV
jgi:hypothetical protein